MENLKGYIGKELLVILLQLFVISFLVFVMLRFGPGDPIAIQFPKADPEVRELLREELGYNRNIFVQYGDYMWHFIRGDMGESIKYTGQPVWELLKPRLWISIQLGAAAMLIGFPLGIILGMVAARYRNSWFDTFLISTLMSLRVLPVIILIQFCIFLFALKLNWLPAGGWDGLFSKNIIIPLIVLVLPSLGGGARFTRMNILHVIEDDYVRTAYAKGLPEKWVFLKHILPNAAPPILYDFIVSLGVTLLTGFLFVELLYGIRGIGKLMLESTFAFDYNVIMAFCIIVTSAYLVLRRVADISLGILDPRIRAGEAKRF